MRKRHVEEKRKEKGMVNEKSTVAEDTVGGKEKRSTVEKDTVERISIEQEFVSRGDTIVTIVVAAVLRWVLYQSAGGWLASRPELATPLTSIDRLREGILLKRDLGDAYSGDRVHVTPLMLSFLPDTSDAVVLPLFITLDLLTGVFLSLAALRVSEERGEKRAEEVAAKVMKWYLLCPLSMAACAALSLSVVSIHLLAVFTAAVVYNKSVLGAVVLAISTQFTMYPVILMAPLMSRVKGERVLTLAVVCLTLVALTGVNYHLGGGSWKYAEEVYLFNLLVPDLTPSVGIFWYFFTEIFTHFHQFFLILFQLNIGVYVLPLALTLRKTPFLNLLVSLALLAVFTPYPSLADATPFLALIPAIEEKHWKGMRHILLSSCTILACIVLMPIMWHLWIVSGSGNANFYFGVTLFYNVALIRLAIDIVYSYVKTDLEEKCPEDMKDNKLIYFD